MEKYKAVAIAVSPCAPAHMASLIVKDGLEYSLLRHAGTGFQTYSERDLRGMEQQGFISMLQEPVDVSQGVSALILDEPSYHAYREELTEGGAQGPYLTEKGGYVFVGKPDFLGEILHKVLQIE